jgi:hypothetical protein
LGGFRSDDLDGYWGLDINGSEDVSGGRGNNSSESGANNGNNDNNDNIIVID